MDARRWLLTLPSFLALIGNAAAYIPAQAVTDTTALNLTDGSSLDMIWSNGRALPGVYGARVSYQLQADVPTGGIDKGAFIYFSESTMGANLSTTTPWIAYVSCDQNETDASQEWDIFTLARDRGAVAALMYSNTAESCSLSQEYITDFEKPLDVFATTSQSSARIIDSKLQNATTDDFKTYNGTKLNISGIDVNASLIGTPPSNRSYIAATLTVRNSTGQVEAPGPTSGSSPGSGPRGNKNQSTAMIVLYAITGIVSVLFLVVIVFGGVRALRHPERYGARRERDLHGNGGPQTTAGGVAQAILDTFPIIKFARHRTEREPMAYPTYEDDGSSRAPTKYTSTDEEHSMPVLGHDRTLSEGSSVALHPVRSAEAASVQSGRDTEILGTVTTEVDEETCPICLLDFETGDDLRVLPCEKEHSYHQACIDPWLLQVASSCPLCRKDFSSAPESPVGETAAEPPLSATQPPTASGFARYLAFMRRERPARRSPRQRRQREADQSGPGPF